MKLNLTYKVDFDRSLNKQQWKAIDHFRRMARRKTERALEEFDWTGYAKDLILYGHASYRMENGKMVFIKQG